MSNNNSGLSVLRVISQLNAESFTQGNDLVDASPGTLEFDGLDGIDTLSYFSATTAVTASLLSGGMNAGAAFGHTFRNIENLTGSKFADRLTGDEKDNVLDGGIGADTLTGGKGNDTYIVDNRSDKTIELLNEGIDTVRSTITWTLGANLENLTLTGSAAINGTGNALNNIIIGNPGRNTLTGGAGDDTLDGGAGADTLVGGTGNDTYYVDHTSDRVTESAKAGTDTVNASVSYTLGANVENLFLIGTANINGTGNTMNNELTGNAGNNILNGGAGNDRLDGGAGIDTLIGGTGDDIYVVDNEFDIVTEAAKGGTDTVLSTATRYTLAANVENLTLIGAARINGSGNTLANIIKGNSASNELDGMDGDDTLEGGSGNDILKGGDGIDYLYGDEGSDQLYGDAGDDFLFGGAGRDILYGGAGDDTLDGGAGIDEMHGGDGNDTYVVSSDSDKVIEERAEGGVDTVRSYVSFTLGEHVEELELLGEADINGHGNDADNSITGNDGNNIIDGGGGFDNLFGRGGDDLLIVESGFAHGDAGDDKFEAKGGSATLYGGEGDDTYDVLGNYIIVEEADGGIDTVIGYVSFTLGAHIENGILKSTEANNKLTGNEIDNELTLGEADGELYGMGGDDTLRGHAGNNKLYGGAGNDILMGDAGEDIIDGGEGTDTAVFASAFAEYSFIWNADRSTLSVTISDETDELTNIEVLEFLDFIHSGPLSELDVTNPRNLVGNDQDNILTGANGNDVLTGGAGNDHLFGGQNDDILYGGAGDDHLHGEDGNDIIHGGEGNDTFYVGTGTDELYGGGDEADTAQFKLNRDDYDFSWDSNSQTLTVTNGSNVVTLHGFAVFQFNDLRITNISELDPLA